MSFSRTGDQIICDGQGCSEAAAVPVALRPILSSLPAEETRRIDGWLFTVSRDGARHFCPKCIAQGLNGLTDAASRRETHP